MSLTKFCFIQNGNDDASLHKNPHGLMRVRSLKSVKEAGKFVKKFEIRKATQASRNMASFLSTVFEIGQSKLFVTRS